MKVPAMFKFLKAFNIAEATMSGILIPNAGLGSLPKYIITSLHVKSKKFKIKILIKMR